jgi:hypothetical protein
VARARTAREERATGIRAPEAKVLRKYVSIVSQLQFVEQVRAESGYEGLQIWTVIDSEPFADEPRDQVFSAELQAWDQSSKALVDFRLINRREYGDEAMEWALPKDAHIAWRRSPQA